MKYKLGDPAPEDHNQINYYKCPVCGCNWDDEWSCACDDSCPNCGTKNISPIGSDTDPNCKCEMCKLEKDRVEQVPNVDPTKDDS